MGLNVLSLARPSTRRSAPRATHYRWAALALFALTIYGSVLPFQFRPLPLETAVDHLRQIKLFALSDMEARGDWMISTVLFAIFSYSLMGALCVDRSKKHGMIVAPLIVAACFALTILIEFLQIFFPPRTVSINDILVESAGAVLGTLLWLIAGQRITGWLRRLGKVTTIAELAGRLLPGYVVILLVAELMPFDFLVSQHELSTKMDEGRIQFVPFSELTESGAGGLTKCVLNLCCFIPLGLLHALACRRQTASAESARFRWWILAVPLIVELLQLFVYSRSFTVTDIITGITGVFVGSWLARLVPSANERANLDWTRAGPILRGLVPFLLLGWLAGVAYLYWRPFDFTTNPASFVGDQEDFDLYGFRRMAVAPFADYYWGSKYNALDQFARKALSFFPLGILGALWLRDLYSKRAVFCVLLAAFVVAVILEAGRYFLPAHIPSTTDILIGCAGASLGFALTRWVRIILWAESNIFGWQNDARCLWIGSQSLPISQ